MSTLFLYYWLEDDDVCMLAWDEDGVEEELRLEAESPLVLQQITTIYDILEAPQIERAQEFHTTLRLLSERLLKPFAALIDTHTLIRFTVTPDLIKAPLDLLLHRDQYLFVQRPVCYQVDIGLVDDEPQFEIENALVLADSNSAPLQACLEVAKQIDGSLYAEGENAIVAVLEEHAEDIDLIVVSARGRLNEDNTGAIVLNDEELDAEQIAQFGAWIVYFDSSQQGINTDYLGAFQYLSSVEYYVAPIISTEANRSYSDTMLWFMEKLLASKNPFQALFETRQRLFNDNSAEAGSDPIEVLRESYAFRLYEFVEYIDDEEDELDGADFLYAPTA